VVIVAGVEVDEARLAALCEQYGVQRLSLFGSVARGTDDSSSDVDVMYEMRPGRRRRQPGSGGRSSRWQTICPHCSGGRSTLCLAQRCITGFVLWS
jgi:hypothetical protein